jgi:hypothetical protein
MMLRANNRSGLFNKNKVPPIQIAGFFVMKAQ